MSFPRHASAKAVWLCVSLLISPCSAVAYDGYGSIAANDFRNYFGNDANASFERGQDAVRRWAEAPDGSAAESARAALDAFIESADWSGLDGVREGLNRNRDALDDRGRQEERRERSRTVDSERNNPWRPRDANAFSDYSGTGWGARQQGRALVDSWASAAGDADKGATTFNAFRQGVQEAIARGDVTTLKGIQDGLADNRAALESRDAGLFAVWSNDVARAIAGIEAALAQQAVGREAARDYVYPADGDRGAAYARLESFVAHARDAGNVNQLIGLRDALAEERKDGRGGLSDADLDFWSGAANDTIALVTDANYSVSGQQRFLDSLDAQAKARFGSGPLWDWDLGLDGYRGDIGLYRDGRVVLYTLWRTKIADLDAQIDMLNQLLAPVDAQAITARATLDQGMVAQARQMAELEAERVAAETEAAKFKPSSLSGIGRGGSRELGQDIARRMNESLAAKKRADEASAKQSELLVANPFLGQMVTAADGTKVPAWKVLADPSIKDGTRAAAVQEAIQGHLANVRQVRTDIAGLTSWEEIASLLLDPIHTPLQGLTVGLLSRRYGLASAGATMNYLVRAFQSHQEDVRLQRQGRNVTYMAIGTGVLIFTGVGAIALVGAGAGAGTMTAFLVLTSAADAGFAGAEYVEMSRTAAEAQAAYDKLAATAAAGGSVDPKALALARERNQKAQNELWWAKFQAVLSAGGLAADAIDAIGESLRAAGMLRPRPSTGAGALVFDSQGKLVLDLGESTVTTRPVGGLADAATPAGTLASSTARIADAAQNVDLGQVLNRIDAEVAAGSLEAPSALRDRVEKVLRNVSSKSGERAREAAKTLAGTRVQFPGVNPGDPPMVYELTGEYLGAGWFNMVFGARAISPNGPQTPVVIKFGVKKDEMGDAVAAFPAFRGQIEGAQLLDQHGIPHTTLFSATTEGGVPVSLWARFEPGARELAGDLSLDDQAKVFGILQSVARANLFAPDLKLANLIDENGVKIVDTDLFISKQAMVLWKEGPSSNQAFGDLAQRVEEMMSQYPAMVPLLKDIPSVVDASGGSSRVVGVLNLMSDPIHFSELMMFAHEWLRTDANGQIVSGRFSADLAKLYFPQLGTPGARSADLLQPPDPAALAALGVKTGTEPAANAAGAIASSAPGVLGAASAGGRSASGTAADALIDGLSLAPSGTALSAAGRIARQLDQVFNASVPGGAPNASGASTNAAGSSSLPADAGVSPESIEPAAGENGPKPFETTGNWVLQLFREDGGEPVPENAIIRDDRGLRIGTVVGPPLVIPGGGESYTLQSAPENARTAAEAVARQFGGRAVVTPEKISVMQRSLVGAAMAR